MQIVKANEIINKHFILLEKQNTFYSTGDFTKCINFCLQDIKLFNEFREAYIICERQMCIDTLTGEFERPFNASDVIFPYYPAFATLSKVYEKQGLYDKAIAICDLAIEYGLHDDTKSDFAGRICRLEKRKTQPPKNTLKEDLVKENAKKEFATSTALQLPEHIKKMPWYISVSFGKSSSDNFAKAIFLSESASYYLEMEVKGTKIYQAFFTSEAQSYLKFIQLYELVGSWKSSFVMVNGELVDRKIIGGLNYCYGDKCRTGRSDFCYGASFMTKNPFGCHRLQMSAYNSPWWSFSTRQGNGYVIHKEAIMARAMEYGTAYTICPCFNQEHITNVINGLPDYLTDKQSQVICNENAVTFANPLKEVMLCPNCGSTNVTVQAVTETKTKHRGCLSWFFWIILALFTFGLILIIPFLTNSKSKSKIHSEAVCQQCGRRWNV